MNTDDSLYTVQKELIASGKFDAVTVDTTSYEYVTDPYQLTDDDARSAAATRVVVTAVHQLCRQFSGALHAGE